ncbi:ER lumen protein-retaining receptor [Armadillidium vulgare]|nr:ER lumen protein-retaining receptor [Armadillidium vulgare]
MQIENKIKVNRIVFLAAAFATLYLMYVRFRATYDHNHDTFRIEFLVLPTAILSLVINHDFSPLELFMVSKTGEAESITSHYLFALGSYRGLYIFNWVSSSWENHWYTLIIRILFCKVYRYYVEGFYDLIAIVAGVVQTVLYCDFFYLYITKELSKFYMEV